MSTPAEGKRIAKILDGVVHPMGFARTGQNWQRCNSETICRLNLQKSRNQYYLNFAVSLIRLNNNLHRTEPVWHIVGRMFSPSVREKIEWEHCLNILRKEVSGKPREARLLEILQERIVPLLRAFETLEGVKAALFSGQLSGMGIRTELQDLTGYKS